MVKGNNSLTHAPTYPRVQFDFRRMRQKKQRAASFQQKSKRVDPRPSPRCESVGRMTPERKLALGKRILRFYMDIVWGQPGLAIQ